LPVEERIARQFAFLHLKAQQAGKPTLPSVQPEQVSKPERPAPGPDKVDQV
jgi:hypothetical protein